MRDQLYNIAVESHGLWQLIENNLESGWRVLLKLTRISLIIVLYRTVCHFSGWAAGAGRKLRILSPGFTDLRIISRVQPSARARQTFIEKENKGIWLRNYAMIRRCWQLLVWPVPALVWTGHSCRILCQQCEQRLTSSQILVVLKSMSILNWSIVIKACTSQHFPEDWIRSNGSMIQL